MSEAIGVCNNHPAREGKWYGENTFLCTECKAKEIVVTGVFADFTPPDLRPIEPDPLLPMRRIIGMLTHAAIDRLWYASPDSMPDDPSEDQKLDHLGCCPQCCAPCDALAQLGHLGFLDEWVRYWPENLPGNSWWDAANNRVDREFLARAWGQTDKLGCHHE